jgi:hypothetical protein
LDEEYLLGEKIEIKIKNFGDKNFEVKGKGGTCYDFQIFDSREEELPINELYCELAEIWREPYSIKPSGTKIIGKWDQKIYCETIEQCDGKWKKAVQKGIYEIRAFGLRKTIQII